MSELNCRGCQTLMKVGEIYIDGFCPRCQNKMDKRRHVLEKHDGKKTISKDKARALLDGWILKLEGKTHYGLYDKWLVEEE